MSCVAFQRKGLKSATWYTQVFQSSRRSGLNRTVPINVWSRVLVRPSSYFSPLCPLVKQAIKPRRYPLAGSDGVFVVVSLTIITLRIFKGGQTPPRSIDLSVKSSSRGFSWKSVGERTKQQVIRNIKSSPSTNLFLYHLAAIYLRSVTFNQKV